MVDNAFKPKKLDTDDYNFDNENNKYEYLLYEYCMLKYVFLNKALMPVLLA